MYEAFYQLSANPFRLTPDPEFCFSYPGYTSAREYLDCALLLGEGFIMVTGQPGTGKTTLAETFLKDLDLNRNMATRIVASGLEADDLLRAVAYAYGVEAQGLDKATLRRRIQQHFLQQEKYGRRVLLIIDEAQGLTFSGLEELRLLADLQVASQPLLQLFLLGQEKLRDLMGMPEMEPFQQRVIASCHLTPLSLPETRLYIAHRLQRAGWKGDPDLTGAALLAIYRCSRGVPRHINKICNRLLLLGFGKGKHALDEEDVQTVSAELREELLTPMEEGQENLSRNEATPSEAEPEGELLALCQVALSTEGGAAQNAVIARPVAPVSRPRAHLETLHAQQAAAWRMGAEVTARGGKPSLKPPESRSTASFGHDLFQTCQHFGPALAQLFRRQLRGRGEMTFALAALVLATLSVAGLATFSGGERSEETMLSGGRPEPTEPSMRSHGGRPGNTEKMIPQSGRHKPVSPAPAAVVVATPAESPAGGNRVHVQGTGVDVAAATQQPAPAKADIEPDSPASVAARPADATELQRDGTVQLAVAGASGVVESNHLIPTAMPPVESGAHSKEATANSGSPDMRKSDSSPAGSRKIEAVPDRDHAVPPAVSRERKIAALLDLGRQSVEKYRLLTPAGDNAYEYFQQVLALDPGNPAARDGLDQIVAGYVTLARRASERQDSRLTKLYISRGLGVQPDNPELLALQANMQRPPVEVKEVVVLASPESEPEPQSPPKHFYNWLKSLFKGAQPGQTDTVE